MPSRSKPSVVLGVSYGHGDSSAALIVNGQLVAAAEEERFNRIKHYALFPSLAIGYCLAHAKLKPAEVEVVAIARQPLNQIWKRVSLYLTHPALLKSSMQRKKSEGLPLSENLKNAGLQRARVKRTEHHLAHLYSARYLFPKENVALLSLDGLGDFASTTIAKPTENGIEILDRVLFPHSAGFFYTALTQFLGFPYYGDEFKVMGLSSYGEPTYLREMRQLIREKDKFGFELNLEAFPILKHPIEMGVENGQPTINRFYNVPFLTHLIGFRPRKPTEPLTKQHWNLAKSVQTRFEEIGYHVLKQLHSRIPSETLALAGGCSHNSVWVGKIPANTPFKKVAVAPASHDAGIAVGAAIAAANCEVTVEGGHWGLLGPDHNESPEPKSTTENFDMKAYKDERKLIQFLVDEMADGKIVGLFHGRMEFGPRALGTRSIICDPRGKDAKDKLNARVKHREAFRPFAASVLEEYQDSWFENTFYCPYMEAVFTVKESVRKKIPAVTHVDNTCRIQSVTKETQPFYWNLIEAFRKKTGVPMLLNTSFNDCEPIVCTEQDALNCFMNTEMDYLVVGTKLYQRKASMKKTA